MRGALVWWGVIAPVGALLAASGPAGTPPAAPPAPVGILLDRVVDSAAARGFSGVVLVGATRVAGDSVLYERAVGVADRSTGAPVRADAVWRWASVTKQVTAALVLQQVDAGRVALDAPAARYLPELAQDAAGAVTVRQLLRHTSGLPNPEDTPRDADGIPRFYRGTAARDAAAAGGYCTTAPKRPPGAAFEYNNCDYLLLGALLERVTGRPVAALVRERIAEPLGLRSVRLAADGARIVGYAPDGRREPAIDLAAYGAAGALHGTARDLLAFDRALLRHRLVSPASTAEMWRGDPRLGYAALGAWAFSATLRACTGPVALVERRGAIGGVQVRNFIAPELGRAVVAFTNDAGVEFGEVWQGTGLSHALLSAALCGSTP